MAFSLRFACPHPVLVDLDGTWHHVWCPCVQDDGGDYDKYVRLEADQAVERSPAPYRCTRCYPDVRIVGAPASER